MLFVVLQLVHTDEEVLNYMNSNENQTKQKIAVFDLDGTSISKQSGKLFAQYVYSHKYISHKTALKLVWWGLRYIFHLPCHQSSARELIYSGFKGMKKEDVEKIMHQFHQEKISSLYRQDALNEVKKRQAEGCVCILVSAAFDIIAQQACEYMELDGFVATKMELDSNNCYTARMYKDAVEGPEKLKAVQRWADEHIGKDKWVLEYAYGDHHSDQCLLRNAVHGFAVSPGWALKKVAKEENLTILNWN